MMAEFLNSKITKLLLMVLAVSFVSSCAKKKEDAEEIADKNQQFFQVVYQTRASRVIGTTQWNGVQGVQRLKFEQTNADSEDFTQGKFTVQLDSYREPQLANQGLCSGGFTGTFSIQDSTTVPDEDDTAPYDPLSPYNPGYSDSPDVEDDTIDPATGKPRTDLIYTFVFTLNVTQRSFAPGCSSSINPQDSFTLTVVRYPNGDLIVTNNSRSLDHYFLPELVQ